MPNDRGRRRRGHRHEDPAEDGAPPPQIESHVHSLAQPVEQEAAIMDRTARIDLELMEPAFFPIETVAGPLDAGVLLVRDHASNAIPPGYCALGLGREALERHIAYDIGAADLTRALAVRLNAPAVLSTFSRLL